MQTTTREQQGDDEAVARAEATARAIIDEVPRPSLGSLVIPTRVLALMVLLEPRDRSVAEAKEILGITQASASLLIDEAEAIGVVQRFRHRADHRVTVVRLSPKGHHLRRIRRGSGGPDGGGG